VTTLESASLFDDPWDGMTLDQLRAWLSEHRDEGVHCPGCNQYAKVYRRSVTVGIARVLIAMYRDGGDDAGWVYIPSLRGIEKGGDTAKARYWGLIEELPERREDGGRVGWWRLTDQGKAFVRGEVAVPYRARVYDGHLLELVDDRMVTIRDALGTAFNYDNLMNDA
jgi:hypothetical protein